ncbi:hypothetical protein SBC1_59430 (plasmid) [Caballeronia sp. SBC1]|nr:hypothetical protein SBC2_59070 [Caballeronia sp. SBC2]QIN65897.1 hypothetical protein SBC1_59430 [Caballeronia sp. SBC1]
MNFQVMRLDCSPVAVRLQSVKPGTTPLLFQLVFKIILQINTKIVYAL